VVSFDVSRILDPHYFLGKPLKIKQYRLPANRLILTVMSLFTGWPDHDSIGIIG